MTSADVRPIVTERGVDTHLASYSPVTAATALPMQASRKRPGGVHLAQRTLCGPPIGVLGGGGNTMRSPARR